MLDWAVGSVPSSRSDAAAVGALALPAGWASVDTWSGGVGRGAGFGFWSATRALWDSCLPRSILAATTAAVSSWVISGGFAAPPVGGRLRDLRRAPHPGHKTTPSACTDALNFVLQREHFAFISLPPIHYPPFLGRHCCSMHQIDSRWPSDPVRIDSSPPTRLVEQRLDKQGLVRGRRIRCRFAVFPCARGLHSRDACSRFPTGN